MDLIDRQDAIGKIQTWLQHSGYSEGERNVMGCAIQMLEGLPSMQVPSYVAEIEEEYKKAVSQPWIHKPLAKALYEVWKKHDREDVSRHETDYRKE